MFAIILCQLAFFVFHLWDALRHLGFWTEEVASELGAVDEPALRSCPSCLDSGVRADSLLTYCTLHHVKLLFVFASCKTLHWEFWCSQLWPLGSIGAGEEMALLGQEKHLTPAGPCHLTQVLLKIGSTRSTIFVAEIIVPLSGAQLVL